MPEVLYFLTFNGGCGHTEMWDCVEVGYDADGWLEKYGERIGSGTAKLPTGGWIDLSQFATISKTK